ncbi:MULTISPECIES: ABC transporter ATP-binding protein [unclassified Streptomyces]|uniref:ABC transporter ATP-binding protein n=1 Tax=unclassified Streptomyces TaxID=2593676 RepID=UPI00093D7C50|nr:ABC transporter ATP-binding protein [Streptomyces sp. CB02058]OKI94013.1 hypothetical protein AMK10_16760 [Streptomyces sp. CB02058]
MTVLTQPEAAAPESSAPAGVGAWLLSHLRRYKRYIAVHLLGSVLWHVMTAGIPMATGIAFDAVLQEHADFSAFNGAVAALLVMVLVRGLAGGSAIYALEAFACGLERDARKDIFSSLLRKSQTFFNRRPVGDLSARATGDAEAMNLMMSPGVDMAVDLVLSLLVPIVFVALIDPELLLSPVVFIILFVVALLEHGRRLEPVSLATRKRFGLMSAQVSEAVTGIESVEATGRRAAVQKHFAELADDYRAAFVAQGRTQALYIPPLLLTLALALGLLHGVNLVRSGDISIGELVAFLGLMGSLRAPTQLASLSIGLIYLGVAGARRMLEVINDPSGDDEQQGGHSAVIDGGISFENVTFGYGDTPVLRDISFTVPPGATVALVGTTGSGKSTLLHLLNRTYEADEGRVVVDGVDVTDWNLRSLRSQIAVIEQDVMLFSTSIGDNLAFGAGADISRERLEEAARMAQAHDFITASEHGYDTMVGERGITLSGGQRQRIAIGRALVTDPRVLVLDDSTSAVDSATEAQIQQAVRQASSGRTTFLITTRLSRIRSADHILVLDRGRIVGQGDHDGLIESCDLYRRIFAPYLTESRSPRTDEGVS